MMTTDSSADHPITLNDIVEHARSVHAKQGWARRGSDERFLYLTSEVGELSRALIELHQSSTLNLDDKSQILALDAVSDELYDILWNVCDLAEILKIDIDAAARRKQRLMDERTWS